MADELTISAFRSPEGLAQAAELSRDLYAFRQWYWGTAGWRSMWRDNYWKDHDVIELEGVRYGG